jgi:hypothetical protein
MINSINVIKIMRYKLLSPLLMLLTGSLSASGALNGTYTINPATAANAFNYQSLTAALSDLQLGTRNDGGTPNGSGVSGPVIFELAQAAGTNGVDYTLPSITGANSTNTITIRPAATVNTVVQLTAPDRP